MAGAVVYWRATEGQRSRHIAEVDEAIDEGREAAQDLLSGAEPDDRPFDQR